MAVRKVRNSWWVDFWFNHTRHRKRSPDNSRTGAQAYETTLRQKLARGESIDKVKEASQQEQTFEKFAQQWFDDYVMSNNKPSTQKAATYILSGALVPFFGKMSVGKITAQHIEQFKAQQKKRGTSNKTIKNYLTVLNTCLKSAYEWLQLTGAPPKIKWPKCDPPQIDYLSPEECELLLPHADGVVHELILTALRTGMRQGELRGLQWSSIDWQNRTVGIYHSRCDYSKALVPPKNNRPRHIPLHTDVYEMLYKRKKATGYVFLDVDGRIFDEKRLARRLAKVRKDAGLRRFGWHTLRHTFASHLVMRGVPLPAVQTLMGHASITTTMRYAHLAPSTLQSAIDMLDPKWMVNANLGQPVVNQWQKMQQQEMSAKSVLVNHPVPESTGR